MSKVYARLLELCWGLGLICTVISVVLRLLPALQVKLRVSPRGGLILASALLLCALATAEVRKTPPSS